MKARAIISVLLLAALAAGFMLAGLACTTSLLPKKDGAVDYQRIFDNAYTSLSIGEPSQRPDQQPLVLAHYMP